MCLFHHASNPTCKQLAIDFNSNWCKELKAKIWTGVVTLLRMAHNSLEMEQNLVFRTHTHQLTFTCNFCSRRSDFFWSLWRLTHTCPYLHTNKTAHICKVFLKKVVNLNQRSTWHSTFPTAFYSHGLSDTHLPRVRELYMLQDPTDSC